MKSVYDKNLEVGEIVKLQKGDVGKVLEITEEGMYVRNLNEVTRIRNKFYKQKKCDYCGENRNFGELFETDDGKYKCKICCDREIREEIKKEKNNEKN